MSAAAAVPSPPLPPPPASRRAAATAALVRSRRELVATAVTVVIYLILAMVLLLFVGRIGSDACGGDGCPVFAATDGVLIGTTGSLAVVGLVAAVCTIFLTCCMKPEKAPDPNDLAAADRGVLRVLILGMLASLGFIMLTLAGFLLLEASSSPVEGSTTQRICSITIDVAAVSLLVLNCFVLLPAMALFAWKRISVIWQRL